MTRQYTGNEDEQAAEFFSSFDGASTPCLGCLANMVSLANSGRRRSSHTGSADAMKYTLQCFGVDDESKLDKAFTCATTSTNPMSCPELAAVKENVDAANEQCNEQDLGKIVEESILVNDVQPSGRRRLLFFHTGSVSGSTTRQSRMAMLKSPGCMGCMLHEKLAEDAGTVPKEGVVQCFPQQMRSCFRELQTPDFKEKMAAAQAKMIVPALELGEQLITALQGVPIIGTMVEQLMAAVAPLLARSSSAGRRLLQAQAQGGSQQSNPLGDLLGGLLQGQGGSTAQGGQQSDALGNALAALLGGMANGGLGQAIEAFAPSLGPALASGGLGDAVDALAPGLGVAVAGMLGGAGGQQQGMQGMMTGLQEMEGLDELLGGLSNLMSGFLSQPDNSTAAGTMPNLESMFERMMPVADKAEETMMTVMAEMRNIMPRACSEQDVEGVMGMQQKIFDDVEAVRSQMMGMGARPVHLGSEHMDQPAHQPGTAGCIDQDPKNCPTYIGRGMCQRDASVRTACCASCAKDDTAMASSAGLAAETRRPTTFPTNVPSPLRTAASAASQSSGRSEQTPGAAMRTAPPAAPVSQSSGGGTAAWSAVAVGCGIVIALGRL